MRTNKEINYAVALLRQKDDRISLTQTEVLELRLTEKAVFEKYVANVPAEEKDEAVFFAARDAARYLAGGIALEELIPDAEDTLSESNIPELDSSDGEMILVSKRTLQNLLLRVSRLELIAGIRNKQMKVKRKSTTTSNMPDDLISQVEVIRLLGCGKTTIKRWANKGYITGYQKDGRVYYSKKEIRNSQAFKEYLIASGKKIKL